MLTRVTCDVCKKNFAYRFHAPFSSDHGCDALVICASEYNLLEVSIEIQGERLARVYGRELEKLGLILRYQKGSPEIPTGLTGMSAKGLSLELWEAANLRSTVGSLIDDAMRAWLALPLEERCPS